MNLPEIRIRDGWLLRENASQYLHELWGQEGSKLADNAWMRKQVESYQKAWQPYESKILNGACGLLDLEYRQNIIDAYIAPWFYAFSNPLVVGVIYEPDEFIDILTHELLHRLLTDNTALPYDTDLKPRWQKLFGSNQNFKTLIHIPVHATLKAIYLDILKEPERLERDIEDSKKIGGAYTEAWDYVNEHDYWKIVQQLKDDYHT